MIRTLQATHTGLLLVPLATQVCLSGLRENGPDRRAGSWLVGDGHALLFMRIFASL